MSQSAAAVKSLHGVGVSERLMSLDALRGFDMMWIVGADALGRALEELDGGPVLRAIATQLDHVSWAGFRFYDLIFPLFVFMIGVAVTFSLGKLAEREGRGVAVRRVLRRTLLLYALGLFYYGGISKGLDHVRWVGVLQRLGLCYGFAGLCFLYLKPRQMVAVAATLLVGYWAAMTFVPVPGFGAGDYAEGHNLANWIDQQFLPGRKWDGTHDPEGLLSAFPAFVSALLGVFAGLLLQDRERSGERKALLLAAAGCVSLVLGFTWGLKFPVIKKLWTSSFVLVAGGWSALLLAAFYYVIDVRKVRAWAVPFTWIGTNALTIYLISNLVYVEVGEKGASAFDKVPERLVGGPVAAFLDHAVMPHFGGLVNALTGLALAFLICRFLHKRQIFLRL